jgi:hypothetical protein
MAAIKLTKRYRFFEFANLFDKKGNYGFAKKLLSLYDAVEMHECTAKDRLIWKFKSKDFYRTLK